MNSKNDRNIDKPNESPTMKNMKLAAVLSFAVTGVFLSASALFGQSTNGPTPVQLQPMAPIIAGGLDSVPLDDPHPNYSSVIIAGGTPQATVVPNAVTPPPTLVHVAVPTAPVATPTLPTAPVVSQATPAFVSTIRPQTRFIIARPGPPRFLPHH
jgi:hypothetical protein